jgi:hypothetical protein
VLASPFKSKSRLEAENAVLRHQLIVLRPRVHPRIKETRAYEVGSDALRGQFRGKTLEVNPISPCFEVAEPVGKPRKEIYGSNVDNSTAAVAG